MAPRSRKRTMKGASRTSLRAIWSGAISFGLVNIPVRLYSPTGGEEIDFDYLHKKDRAPIRYARICTAEEKEVPYEDIVRGAEIHKGVHVVLSDEDFERANVQKTRTISIVDFVEEQEIDSLYYDKPYYVEPDEGADKPYALLREALERSGKVAVAKFVLRNREHIAVIKPLENLLVVNQLRFYTEIQKPKGLQVPDTRVERRELEIALALIEKLTAPFRPQQYRDEYIDELKELIAKKAKGKTPRAKGREPAPTNVDHLMSTLRSSLQRARKRQPA